MENVNVETLFSSIDECVTIIQNESDQSYLDTLIHVGEMIFQSANESQLSEDTSEKVNKILATVKIANYSEEQLQKAFYFAVLKGMKEGTQPNHVMTPDAVALFISYLVNKMTGLKDSFQLLDPCVGAGNLISTILTNSPKKVIASGIEPDETLLRLAYVSANLREHKIELFHQDSLKQVFINPVDIVVADLPIGYYPNNIVAENYILKAKQGMSYTHHLLIEQSLNYTKEGGFLIFLIPNNMFESEQAKQLHTFIKEKAHIYSLMQLPKSMFKSEKQGKSIFILRKKKEGIKAPSQALLVELPSFSNEQAMSEMLKSINNWFDVYVND